MIEKLFLLLRFFRIMSKGFWTAHFIVTATENMAIQPVKVHYHLTKEHILSKGMRVNAVGLLNEAGIDTARPYQRIEVRRGELFDVHYYQ